MLPTITEEKIDLPPGTVIQFPASIAEYEQLLDRLGDRSIPRLRFRDNRILLMSPLPEHGKEIDVIADLVKMLLRHQGLDWDSFHPITLKYMTNGLEPDACFYIQNFRSILGKRKIDLSVDPPPDLAIEIDVTSFTHIEDYIPLAIPEVWIYRGNKLRVYCFTDNSYIETETSSIFPNFSIKEIVSQYVSRAWQVGSSVALNEFSQTLEKTSD